LTTMAARSASPVIGITPDLNSRGELCPGEHFALAVSEQIPRALLNAGGIPMVLPPISSRHTLGEALRHLDGIVVTGGNFDIHPRYYGESPLEGLRDIKELRTQFELALISLALARDLPLLGICGGEQAINVALGGSLYQDIATQVPRAMDHEQRSPKDHAGHKTRILPGTKLHQILGCKVLETNTTHHQAVKEPGKGLVVNAIAEDGIIEAIESKDHTFVLGVQWHPEYLTREVSQEKIFSYLVSACRRADW